MRYKLMINYFNIPLFRSEHVSGERISEFISFEYCILAGAASAVTKKAVAKRSTCHFCPLVLCRRG